MTLEDCACLQNGRWESRGEGEAMQSVKHPPLPLKPSFITTTTQCSTVQSGSDQRAGFQPLWLGYHDNCVLLQLPWLPRWWSDASSSSCWLSVSLEGYTGGLAGSGFTQCHGVADSGPNSGTSDALGHSGTEVVGGVGGGVEEVLVVLVVVVVRSRYQ